MDLLAGHLVEVGQEVRPGFLVDGWILDRRVGENQSVRIDELGRIGRNVGDHVAVNVAIAFIERSALAIGSGCGQRRRDCQGNTGDGAQKQ